MPASLSDSELYGCLFGDAETAAHFTDEAELAAMLLVEGALARVQGDLGLIPIEASDRIVRASEQVRIPSTELSAETARNGVPVPGLIAAFRKTAAAPEAMRFAHWGATSQDIMDTALVLRLRQVLDLWSVRLDGLIAALGQLARAEADLPMAARTYGQIATPTTFGAVVASWGRPLLRHRRQMAHIRDGLLQVSLSGAAGTLSAMGPDGAKVRARLAALLSLGNPESAWHAERDAVLRFGHWMTELSASLGKMGEDLILLCQSGLCEVRISSAGGSSTMPQKQNPVVPSVLVALARQIGGLSATLAGAALHRQQRDGAAWYLEWLTLPQMCVSTGCGLRLAQTVVVGLRPDAAAMARVLDLDGGTIHAEALSFALAVLMPRPAAEAAVKRLCAEALETGRDLRDLASRDWPDVKVPLSLGQASAEARAFARLASEVVSARP